MKWSFILSAGQVKAFTRIASLLLVVTPLTGRAAPPQATAFQITVDHAGVTTSGGTLALQETPLWRVDLPGRISYPLIADGGVFATSAGIPGGGNGGSQLTTREQYSSSTAMGSLVPSTPPRELPDGVCSYRDSAPLARPRLPAMASSTLADRATVARCMPSLKPRTPFCGVTWLKMAMTAPPPWGPTASMCPIRARSMTSTC